MIALAPASTRSIRVHGLAATPNAARYSRVLLPPQPPLCRSAHRRLLWAYQLVAELGFERDSWVTPADIRRVSCSKLNPKLRDYAARKGYEVLDDGSDPGQSGG